MRPRDLRHLLLALTFVGVSCVLPIVLGAPMDLLLAAPVVLLALPLLTGRYVGEEAIERIARFIGTRAASRRRAPGRLLVRRGLALPPRAGALIAFALDVRPPPVAPVIR